MRALKNIINGTSLLSVILLLFAVTLFVYGIVAITEANDIKARYTPPAIMTDTVVVKFASGSFLGRGRLRGVSLKDRITRVYNCSEYYSPGDTTVISRTKAIE